MRACLKSNYTHIQYVSRSHERAFFSGLAYVESLCSDSSYSIVEDNESIAAITVPVHELAHRFVNNSIQNNFFIGNLIFCHTYGQQSNQVESFFSPKGVMCKQ